jgi:hypothetical protein
MVPSIYSQGSAGESAKYEYRFLIDMPTAGILEKGNVGITTDILPFGVVVARMEVGVFDNISFGISYGGANIIGTGSPKWYKWPGVNFRARILNETTLMPAITLGFDSQGKGEYYDDPARYAIKSPGFFAAGSKNFALLGYLSFHGVVNYSLENQDGDGFVNLLVGVEKTLGSNFSILAEYDFGFNDNSSDFFGKGTGYLNAGINWSVGNGFTIGLELRDILQNKKWRPTAADRGIRMEFIQSIF